MKRLFVLISIFLLGCTVVEVEDLYDENSPGYGALKEAAAKECVANSAIFANLKTTDFTSYPLIKDNEFLKVASNRFIKIDAVTAGEVTFSVISTASDGFSPFLNAGRYKVTIADNDAIVDMLAQGVCEGSYYKGTPSESNSILSFTADNYNILDSTDASTTTKPDVYEVRKDVFSMSTSTPAFLFIWAGNYSFHKKASGDSETGDDSRNDWELSLDASDEEGCEGGVSEVACAPTGTHNTLEIDATAFSKTREQSSDLALKRYYFTNFP